VVKLQLQPMLTSPFLLNYSQVLYNLTIMVKRSNSDESRAEIVSSAKRLFQQYGYKKTTVSDIAKAMER